MSLEESAQVFALSMHAIASLLVAANDEEAERFEDSGAMAEFATRNLDDAANIISKHHIR